MTPQEVVDKLSDELRRLLKDRVWDVRVFRGLGSDSVLVDAYSYSRDKTTWQHGILDNAPNRIRLDIGQWKDGVPVLVSGSGKTRPSDGSISVRISWAIGEKVRAVKPRQIKGTVDKVVSYVIQWFTKNAGVFTGGATAAESVWRHLPSIGTVDTLDSWAEAARTPERPRGALRVVTKGRSR